MRRNLSQSPYFCGSDFAQTKAECEALSFWGPENLSSPNNLDKEEEFQIVFHSITGFVDTESYDENYKEDWPYKLLTDPSLIKNMNNVPSENERIILQWRHNRFLGTKYEEIYDSKISQLAVDATKAISARFASVDIIISEKFGLEVLEMSPSVSIHYPIISSTTSNEYEREVEIYRKVRSKSPEKVLEELDYLNSKFGFTSFMWFDDEVNVNSSRLLELSKRLQKRNYSHRGFIRSDLLVKHPETLDYLVDAGFVELCSGVESGSARILQRVDKGTTPEINSQAAQMIKDKNLTYKAFTLIGHPGETYEDVEKTKEWIRNNKPDGLDISILMPYPGSRLYDHSKPSLRYEGFNRSEEHTSELQSH